METCKILVELQEHMGSDASIANAAWTSTYNLNTRYKKYKDTSEITRIVTNCIMDGHSVPVESVCFRFWIRMPIFTDRQHMTHRVASHNGLSGRYRTMPTDYYQIPDDVADILDKCVETSDNWKAVQGHDKNTTSVYNRYIESCETAVFNYKTSIDFLKLQEKQGIITNSEFKRVREIIRAQLPTAGMTERTTIMNLRSFANYIRLRTSSHAQPEIRQVATLMLNEVKQAGICPVAISALEQKGWVI